MIKQEIFKNTLRKNQTMIKENDNKIKSLKHILHTYIVKRNYHMNTFYFIYFNFK
jgi:hypothetical protein